MNAPSPLAKRNAIEALRAGVPNRAAIRLLGSGEAALGQDFLGRLGLCNAALRNGEQVEGIILSGGFGAGKSHQLGYFAELAEQEKFVVSQVPISKETPLFDPARLFAAAIRAAVVPNANDDVMTAVMTRLQSEFRSLRRAGIVDDHRGAGGPNFALVRRSSPPDTAASNRPRRPCAHGSFLRRRQAQRHGRQGLAARCRSCQIVRPQTGSRGRSGVATHPVCAAAAARRRLFRLVHSPRRGRVDRPLQPVAARSQLRRIHALARVGARTLRFRAL